MIASGCRDKSKAGTVRIFSKKENQDLQEFKNEKGNQTRWTHSSKDQGEKYATPILGDKSREARESDEQIIRAPEDFLKNPEWSIPRATHVYRDLETFFNEL